MEQTQVKKKWRYGKKRWLVLLFILLGVIAAKAYPPILPHIQLPAESITSGPLFGNFYLTNTMVAMVITDILILIIALVVRRAALSGEMVPRGFSGAVEALLEVIYNLTESTAGKWARAIFPFFASITLFVLVANWTELIPGVDSIGILHQSEHGYAVKELIPGVATILRSQPGAEAEQGGSFGVIPFVRVLSTDLNFTIGLALISVITVQIFGVRAQGFKYFTKFFNVGGIFKRPIFGIIDFGVGLLELVSEFSKILSFSFRLFGNIFAGSVLLFVIGFLVPVLAQSIFLLLEFFVGLIQAFVFGMLTMVFLAQATQGHGEQEGHA